MRPVLLPMNAEAIAPIAWRALAARIVAIALPVIANNLLTVGMQITDAVLAGRLSPQTLAAVSVGGGVYVPFFLFALGILAALSPTSAQLYGAGRLHDIGVAARDASWLALVLAALLMSGFRFLDPLFRVAGINVALAPAAGAYVAALSWGLPAIFLYLVLRFASEGIGHTRPMLYVALAAFLVNIPLDYWFMFGGLGVPRLGAAGCGYATALAQWLALAVMLLYVRVCRRRYAPLRIFAPMRRPQFEGIAALLRLGLPIGVMLFAEVGLFGAAALLMASFGTVTAAAHQVAVAVASFAFMVPMGLATAISVVVGQAAGAGDPRNARRAGMVGIALSLGFEIASAILMFVLREPLARLFTADPAVVALAAKLLALAAAFQLSDGLQVASAGALRGLKDTRAPMFITLVAYWGSGFPLAWAFAFPLGLGPAGVWVGLIAGLTVAGVLLFLRYARRSRPDAAAMIRA
ncbi:MAG TPA: MATE family efflux transporter [Gammaproteobacteria bacterium]|nr:MATE family efflux transporter [Gammaproteobacteria bacterium]